MIIEDRIKKLKTQLRHAVDLKQTCRIYVTTTDGNNTSFYFKQGCLVWASSNLHRFRRLYRLLEKICPEVDLQEFKLREQEISELWEYLSIEVLYKRQQISLKQARKVIQEIIIEVLFDCFVDSDRISQIKVIFETQANSMGAILKSSLLKQPVALVDYKKTIRSLESMVANWKASLPNCLPNHAPIVVDMDKLSDFIDYDLYQKLFMYINGRRTFRDLAILSKQDLLKVARFIAPPLENKAIVVQQIEDRQLTNLYYASDDPMYEAMPSREYIRLDLPLIVYVDRDVDNCQQAIKILNPVGYQIIAVNDAAKTIIVLLKNQPNLIIINTKTDLDAYELCAKIKKISKLKNVPIIICRDREQMLDRLKAKMAGISDFIARPIEPEQLLTLAQKHTQNFANSQLVRS